MTFEKFQGFGEQGGIGKSPALLIIDFMNAFTDKTSKLGCQLDGQIEATKNVLSIARDNDIPIIFTTVGYEPNYKDGANFIKKVPALKELVIGSKAIEIDERLQRNEETESLIIKKFASAFFGTNLMSMLTDERVDTLLIAGCSTSGCVRATAVDGLQYGYKVVVLEDCVGDRSHRAHEANLYDIEMKYG